jgi:hypothetical protein
MAQLLLPHSERLLSALELPTPDLFLCTPRFISLAIKIYEAQN